MPCNGAALTQQQQRARDEQLRQLDRDLKAGKVKVKKVRGKNTLVGDAWTKRTNKAGPGHLHDDCAIRTLLGEGSAAMRRAIATAAATAGTATRQVTG